MSSVEVLMNYHQSLKSEVEARSRSTLECIEMGKTLLAVRNPAAEEVKQIITSTYLTLIGYMISVGQSSSLFHGFIS